MFKYIITYKSPLSFWLVVLGKLEQESGQVFGDSKSKNNENIIIHNTFTNIFIIYTSPLSSWLSSVALIKLGQVFGDSKSKNNENIFIH